MPFTPLHLSTQVLFEAAQAMRVLAERDAPAAGLGPARERMAQAMRGYFLVKEEVLLAPLRQSDDCAHRAIARRAVELDLEWRQHLRAHQENWPAAAIRADPRRYRLVALRMVRMIERRVAHQQQILLPAACEALSQQIAA